MVTIAEHIGAKAHSYIPPKNRGGKRVRDAEGKLSTILRWIKDHEGLPTTHAEIVQDTGISLPSVNIYTARLTKQGRITKQKVGNHRIAFRLGSSGGPRSNGSVTVTRPPAPFTKTQIDQIKLSALDYIDYTIMHKINEQALSNEDIGAFLRHTLNMCDILRSKLDGDIKAGPKQD